MELTYRPFDADNHYYEAPDAFTRHVPEAMRPRCVQWITTDDGHRHHLVGGQIATAVANPTWDPIAKPGALHDYFRGNPDGRNPLEMLADREPLPAHYVDRDARIEVLDEQGLSGVWLFPTLGVLYEELLKHDVEANLTTHRAFNRWLHEDWGFAYQNRIFAAPYITLADRDFAIAELEWALAEGARVVVMRPAPAFTVDGYLSPFDDHFDPFWARVNEAGITVVVHAGDSGYTTNGYDEDGFSSTGIGKGSYKPSIKAFSIERAAHDYLITACLEKLFERFSNLRIASVENGSEFLAFMLRKLENQKHKSLGWFRDDPVELFKQHVWINPFWEDDPYEVAGIMGTDRVIFGSDWPHIEGMPRPLDYLVELKDFDEADIKRIVFDNVVELNTLRPA